MRSGFSSLFRCCFFANKSTLYKNISIHTNNIISRIKKQVVFEVFCFECFRYPLPFGKLYSPVPRMQKNRVKIFAPSLPDFFILISILMLLLSQSPFYYARKSALLSITLLPAVHPDSSVLQSSVPGKPLFSKYQCTG